MGRSHSIYICPRFIFIIFIIFIISVATRIFGHVTLESSKSRSPLKPAESIRKLRFSVAEWMTVRSNYCSNTSSVFFSVQVIHLFGPTNLIANGPKIFTLKETSKRAFGMVSPWARYQKGFVTSHFTLHKPLYKVTED